MFNDNGMVYETKNPLPGTRHYVVIFPAGHNYLSERVGRDDLPILAKDGFAAYRHNDMLYVISENEFDSINGPQTILKWRGFHLSEVSDRSLSL